MSNIIFIILRDKLTIPNYHFILKCCDCNKEWNNTICKNMDEPRDYHPKWNKSDIEGQNATQYHLYMESEK